jgi:CheY-like chemotaxis protein
MLRGANLPNRTRNLVQRRCRVDDDKAVLKSTLRMLDFLGFAGAESGGEALRLIATEPEIGLVLADFAMPEMNGVELTQAVCQRYMQRTLVKLRLRKNHG